MWATGGCAWIGTALRASLSNETDELGGHVDNLSTLFRETMRANVRTLVALIPFSTKTTVTLNVSFSLSLKNVDSTTL